MTEPRWDLIAHIKAQIEEDADAYANAAKLRCVARRLTENLTGRPEDAIVPVDIEEPNELPPSD